jgi:hypothetical protein
LIILSADDNGTDSGDFQQFLLDSPEMTDEEYQAIEEKRRHLNQIGYDLPRHEYIDCP